MALNIIIGLLLFLGLIYYFRQAYTSKKNKSRIVDLLAVGVILWIAPKLSIYTGMDSFEISGILIFAYGWGIFIIEKFWEGFKGENNTLNGN